MARTGFARIAAPEINEGQPSTVQLNRGPVVAAYQLVISGDLVVTGGTGAGAIVADAKEQLLRRVVLSVNNSAKQSYTTRFLSELEVLFAEANSVMDQTPPADDTAGSHPFDFRYLLPMQMPWSFQPEQFGLPTAHLRRPELTLQIGSGANLVTAAGNGAYALENLEAVLLEIPVYRPAIPEVLHASLSIQETQEPVPAAVRDRRIYLDSLSQGSEVARIVIMTTIDDVLAGGVLDDVALVIDDEQRYGSVPAVEVQQRNKRVYGLSAVRPGVYVLDPAEDKNTMYGELWDVRTDKRAYLLLDLSKPAGEVAVHVGTLATSGRDRIEAALNGMRRQRRNRAS